MDTDQSQSGTCFPTPRVSPPNSDQIPGETERDLGLRNLYDNSPTCSPAAKDLTQRRRGRGGTQRNRAFSFSFLCVPPRPLRLCVKAGSTSVAGLPRCVHLCPSVVRSCLDT